MQFLASIPNRASVWLYVENHVESGDGERANAHVSVYARVLSCGATPRRLFRKPAVRGALSFAAVARMTREFRDHELICER